MKEILYVDCLIRGEASRTGVIADAFLGALDPEACHVTHLRLLDEALQPLTGDFFEARQRLLEAGELDHPRFRYAHQFAEADAVVVAAPFWDLSFPALLKIYVENVSVDGITFESTPEGLVGTCRGHHLALLTSRGGFYEGSPLEQGSRYLEALAEFFGLERYDCVAADGLDAEGSDSRTILEGARDAARELAHQIQEEGPLEEAARPLGR